jgi:hypothetical protein
MTCFIHHDDCPITEKWEGHLRCLQVDCYWTCDMNCNREEDVVGERVGGGRDGPLS